MAAIRGLRRIWRHRHLIVDAATAVVLYFLVIATLRIIVDDPTSPYAGPIGGAEQLAAAAATLPLALRRIAPLTVLVVVGVAASVFHLIQPVNLVAVHAATLLALYSAGRHGRPVARDVVRGVGVLGMVGLFAFAEVPPDTPDPGRAHVLGLMIGLTLYGGTWLLGEHTRRSHEREVELGATTAALTARTEELEAERSRSARRAAAEERLRIARELHDVLGHHVSVMGVQAAGAQRALRRDPDAARDALAAIETSSRRAVRDLQEMLTVLHAEEEEPSEDRSATLSGLAEVAEEIEQAGVAVTVQTDDLSALPTAVELAVLRIVQEALTNVLRHAGPGTSAWIRITHAAGALRVVVEDDGRGTPDADAPRSGGGRGLAGLRERVAVHRGDFAAAPTSRGGYRVEASIPVDTASPLPASPMDDRVREQTESRR